MKEYADAQSLSVGALIAAGITLGTAKWDSTWAWRAPSFFQAIFSVLCIIVLPFVYVLHLRLNSRSSHSAGIPPSKTLFSVPSPTESYVR